MDTLLHEHFMHDKSLYHSIATMVDTLSYHQQAIVGITNGRAPLSEKFKQLCQEANTARGGNLYYPYLGSGLGKGPYVELADGSIKLDLICGIGPHFWGHSNKDIIRESLRASLSDILMQGHLQQNTDAIDLMNVIINLASSGGAKLEHCFLSSIGAMANENALKILFQHKQPADRILCFEQCFSGRTLATAEMTDKAAFRQGLPDTLKVDYIPFYDSTSPKEGTERTIDALESHLQRNPDKYAGMCLELIQGEGGFKVGSKKFFEEIFAVLKRHDIPVWIDEIQTFGRTSKPFAFQHFELDKYVDIITMGKMSQVCATIFSNKLKPNPGLLSQTFTASTTAINVANFLLCDKSFTSLFGKKGKNQQLHNCFVKKLKRLNKKYPEHFQGPYGMGGMIAFTVFNGDMQRTKVFLNDLFDAGVITFIAGSNPARVRFLPPIPILEESHIDEAFDVIESTFKKNLIDE